MTKEQLKTLEKAIKFCTKLGIKELKIGEVHVIFGERPQATRKPSKAVIREQQMSEERTRLQEEADQVQEEISVSHVEDPLAYEEAIAKGLLTDESEREEQRTHN